MGDEDPVIPGEQPLPVTLTFNIYSAILLIVISLNFFMGGIWPVRIHGAVRASGVEQTACVSVIPHAPLLQLGGGAPTSAPSIKKGNRIIHHGEMLGVALAFPSQ